MTERAATVAATIAHLAEKAFADFELKYDASTMSWSCRHPENGHHRFRLYFAPGVIFMWGDIGEYAWTVNGPDTLRWYLDQGGKAGDYPDYFLGKLRATNGDAKSFYVGDAYAYIDEKIADISADWNLAVDGLDEDDDERHHIANDVANRKKRWNDLRAKFKELMDEQLNEEKTCWYVACCDVLGDSDPPTCSGWTGHALWSWHACRTFARLHAAIPKTSGEDDTAPITVPG